MRFAISSSSSDSLKKYWKKLSSAVSVGGVWPDFPLSFAAAGLFGGSSTERVAFRPVLLPLLLPQPVEMVVLSPGSSLSLDVFKKRHLEAQPSEEEESAAASLALRVVRAGQWNPSDVRSIGSERCSCTMYRIGHDVYVQCGT